MKFINSLAFLALFGLLLFATSCENDDDNDDNDQKDPPALTGSFKLELDHFFDGAAFQLGQDYTNGSGEVLNFNMVRYYITNIQLEKSDGTMWTEENSYRIVDASDASSTEFTLNDIPTGDYHHIKFMVGVDSARNVSGAQEGALSPANSMFWSWSSGYIFLKLEGTSLQSSSGTFTYHVGGFSGANNAIAKHSYHMHMPNLIITPDATPTAHMEVDLKQAFDGMNTLSVAATPNMTMPGMMAVQISQNFKTAFSLDHIHP